MIQSILKCSAGLDIHKKIIVATVQMEQEDGSIYEETREFGTTKSEYKKLREWLLDKGVQTVVMESTGIYWKRPYAELEQHGMKVLVVNARHVKQVPGRKTDVKDSQWLASLARFGLVNGSFVPDKDFRELRHITRYHSTLKKSVASEKNRLHKLLDDAGIRLGNVLSDIGGKSATAMINGLIKGESLGKILKSAHGSLKKKLPEIEEILDDQLSLRHRFLLQKIQEHIDYINKEIANLEQYIRDAIMAYQRQWKLIQTIPGFDEMSAAKLIVEIGVDMNRFGSVEKLASWAGMCPGNNESAGKRYSGKTRQANKHIRQILCESSQAAGKTRSQFKPYFQGLKIRRGYKKAVMATGHKLLRVVYCLITKDTHYLDPEVNYEALMVERNAPRWIKSLTKFGYLNSYNKAA